MFCSKCGAENPDNALTCASCGESLATSGQTPITGEAFDDELTVDDPGIDVDPQSVPEISPAAGANPNSANSIPEPAPEEIVPVTVVPNSGSSSSGTAPKQKKRSIKPKLILILIVVVPILALFGSCQAGCFKTSVPPAQVCSARAIDFKDGAKMPDQKTNYVADESGNVVGITSDTAGSETISCTYDDNGFLQYAYNESKTVEATAKNTGKNGKLESAEYTLGKIKINVSYTYNDSDDISGYTISSEGGLGVKASSVVNQLVPSSTLISDVAMQGGTATESFDEDGYLVSATFTPSNGSRGSAATYSREIDKNAKTMTVKILSAGSTATEACTLDDNGNVLTMVPGNANGQINKVAYKWVTVENPSPWASKMSHLKIG